MAFLVTTGLKCNMMKLHFQAYDFLTSLADWGKFWIVFEIVIYLYCQYEKKYNKWDHDYMIFKINHRYWNAKKSIKELYHWRGYQDFFGIDSLWLRVVF